jgi:hypothetical protein
MVEEHLKNLSLLTSPRNVLFAKKQITTTNNECNTYYFDKRIGTIMWSMYAWHKKYDAMQLIQIKQNRNSDTHIYGSSCFTTRQFKFLLAWQRQDMGDLHNIKWSGENIIIISHILHMLLIRWDANYHVTIWCEMQTCIWMAYSDSTHFLINFHIKYFVFWVTNWKIWF